MPNEDLIAICSLVSSSSVWSAFARYIDRVNDIGAAIACCCIVFACLVSAGNAIVRYVFSYSSNAFLEIQWYLFAYAVLLGAPQVLRLGGHVRVDVLYCQYSESTKKIIDLLGLALFLLPAIGLFAYLSFHPFIISYVTEEQSSNAGGLPRSIVWAALPLGFCLLFLQGISEAIKKISGLSQPSS